MTTTGILLFDDVEELDFAGPWEVLTVARREGDSVVTVAEKPGSSAAVRVCASCPTTPSPIARPST